MEVKLISDGSRDGNRTDLEKKTSRSSYVSGGQEEHINESRLRTLRRPLKDALFAMILPRRRFPPGRIPASALFVGGKRIISDEFGSISIRS